MVVIVHCRKKDIDTGGKDDIPTVRLSEPTLRLRARARLPVSHIIPSNSRRFDAEAQGADNADIRRAPSGSAVSTPLLPLLLFTFSFSLEKERNKSVRSSSLIAPLSHPGSPPRRLVKLATLAVFALIAICVAVLLFVPDDAPEETPKTFTVHSASATEPRVMGLQWEMDEDKEEAKAEPEDGDIGGVPLWRQAVAQAESDAADAEAADAAREDEDVPASLASPVVGEEEEATVKSQEERTTPTNVVEDSTTAYLMERLQTLQGVKSRLNKMKDDMWVMAARAAGIEDATPEPTEEPAAAEPAAGEATDEKEEEEEKEPMTYEEKQSTPRHGDGSGESSEVTTVEGAQSVGPGGDGADDVHKAEKGGEKQEGGDSSLSSSEAEEAEEEAEGEQMEKKQIVSPEAEAEANDDDDDVEKTWTVAVQRAVMALNDDNPGISIKRSTHNEFNADIVNFASGEDVTDATLLEAMKRRRDELWGDATPEAAAAALATGHPCAASTPAREFPSVRTCGNNGAADACQRFNPQPFAKNPLPPVTGLRCTRPLAATPAMSLLWLRPAAGAPRAAAAGPKGNGGKSGGKSGGKGGEDDSEDAMDPDVRAWATSTRGMLAELAAAAGSRFDALTSAGRHRVGALGPAEIVAFTDVAAPSPSSSSSSSSSSATTAPAAAAAAAGAHKDVDRALRKQILVNATHHHIYAMTEMPDAVALNRLATFAASEALLVVRGGEEASVSPGWVRAALVRMGADPMLSVIGVSAAASEDQGRGQGEEEEEENVVVNPDPTRVVLMRRSALVDAGQIPGAPCDGGVGDLSTSWKGFLGAVRERGGTTLTLPASAGGPGKAPPAVAEEKVTEKKKDAANAAAASTSASAACPAPTIGSGCRPPPAAAVLVQYYKREHNIARLSASVLGDTFGAGVLASEAMTGQPTEAGSGDVEFLVNNDSGSHHGRWLRAMAGCARCFLVHSPDVHEIRGYNRLARMTQAPLLAFIQDDDAPRNGTTWLAEAARLMGAKPDLGLLGGKTGRVDPRGSGVEIKARRENVPGYIPGPTWQADGPKFGRGHDKLLKRDADPATGIKYMTVYKVNASPLITRRALFLRVGMFHPGLSCPGDAGIGFDFEYSVRLWYHGYAIGLYDAGFRDARAGGGEKGDRGTRRSSSVVRKRLQQWHRNNALMYYMYPGFHHKAAMRFVAAVARTGPGGVKW